jgi:GNAT superfamily N-acetyltransferase
MGAVIVDIQNSSLLRRRDNATVSQVDLRIRPATIADCEGVASLVERYWQFEQIEGFERGRIVQLLQRFISQPQRSRCWVAAGPAAVYGYLLAVYVFSLEFGGTIAEIDELYVADSHRAKGLGTRLLQQAMIEMRQDGVTYVELQLGRGNQSGRAFYGRLGFAGRGGYELLGRVL